MPACEFDMDFWGERFYRLESEMHIHEFGQVALQRRDVFWQFRQAWTFIAGLLV
jgi:hypothetical protein